MHCPNCGYQTPRTIRTEVRETNFWRRVDKRTPAECWNWQGTLTYKGYGQLGTRGQIHRYAWEIANGEIPKDLYVLHTCDNRKCVNPGHLFLGTALDNARDMVKKGRHVAQILPRVFGEGHYQAKLSEKEVLEIREMRRTTGLSLRLIGLKFGVSAKHVLRIVNGVNWSHLT
jgi:HNH endonuclease